MGIWLRCPDCHHLTVVKGHCTHTEDCGICGVPVECDRAYRHTGFEGVYCTPEHRFEAGQDTDTAEERERAL